MRSYDLIFTAGETKEFNLTNKFLLILQDGGTPIDMNISTDGGVFFPITGVGSGFGFEAPDNGGLNSYTKIFFTSSVAQTVKIYTGNSRAQYNRIGGTVNVSGIISTRENGIPLTNTFKSIGNNLAANGTEQILSPASNINGVVLLRATFITEHSSLSQQGGYYIGPTAPTVPTSTGNVVAVDDYKVVSGVVSSIGRLNTPINIPPGNGIWFLSSLLEAGSHRQSVYTIL